jgi:hypothetical protein
MTLSLLTAMPMITANCVSKTGNWPELPGYKVHRLTEAMNIDGNWDKPQWRNIVPLEIRNYMGEKPEFQPKTQAKLLYDDDNIYVIFRVEDQYVRAVAEEYHGPVWKDSCVEFFFTPEQDISLGYLNLEVNCGGTALLHYQKLPKQDVVEVDVADMEQIEIAHTLPKIINPEITEPVVWTLEYRLPLAIIRKYCRTTAPAPGVLWRANFYKCAEDNSHPHWLTWAVVDLPKPSFHQPEFFSTIEFT